MAASVTGTTVSLELPLATGSSSIGSGEHAIAAQRALRAERGDEGGLFGGQRFLHFHDDRPPNQGKAS